MSNQKTTSNVPSTCQYVQQATAGIAKTTIADNTIFEYVTVGGVWYVREDRWIPVTERLPQLQARVLVHIPTWNVPVLMGRRYGNSPDCWMVYYGTEGGGSDGEYEVEGVTHWMPLPEPPKEETP